MGQWGVRWVIIEHSLKVPTAKYDWFPPKFSHFSKPLLWGVSFQYPLFLLLSGVVTALIGHRVVVVGRGRCVAAVEDGCS